MKSNGLYVDLSKVKFGDSCPLCEYDLLEENNPFFFTT
jgi:hypothetical protein